jgi:hypothetical protein
MRRPMITGVEAAEASEDVGEDGGREETILETILRPVSRSRIIFMRHMLRPYYIGKYYTG